MKITYLDCDGKAKLFSFFRHDYKTKEIDGKYYMIDGGLEGYIRHSVDGKIQHGEVKDLFEEIREQFTWGKNYDENNNRLEKTEWVLLKNLTSSHICGILSYFTNRAYEKLMKEGDFYKNVIDKEWCIIHEIFIQELDYRIKNNLV